MNLRPLGYEPSELPSCSTPRRCTQGYGTTTDDPNQGDGEGEVPEFDGSAGAEDEPPFWRARAWLT